MFPPFIIFYTIMLCAIVSFVSHVCTVPYTSENMNRFKPEPLWSLMFPASPIRGRPSLKLKDDLSRVPSHLHPPASFPSPPHPSTDRPQRSAAVVERAMVCDRNMTSLWTQNERMIIDHHETRKPHGRPAGRRGKALGATTTDGSLTKEASESSLIVK